MTRMRVFWSVYCIVLVFALLVKLLLQFNISAWNIAVVLLLIESAVFLLTGGFGLSNHRSIASGGRHILFCGRITLSADEPDLSLILCTADVDLSAPLPPLTTLFCAFSTVTIRLPEGWSVRTVCHSSLSTITTPHDTYRGFCDRTLILGDGLQAQMELKCLCSDVRILD